MKILLVGACGQLGQALLGCNQNQHSLTPLSHSDLAIDNLSQVRQALQACRPELVMNAAAYTQVDQAETEKEAAYKSNALGPRNLALATYEQNIPLLHISTDYVFDGRAEQPYHEFSPTSPHSVYGASKLAGEHEVRTLNPRHYIVRTAWVYHNIGNNLPLTMLGLAERKQVRVVSDQYGSPTYAPHLARALLELIENAAYGIYHLAGQGATSWYELVQTLYQAKNIQTIVQPVSTAEFPRPAPRPRYSVLTSWQQPRILLPVWQKGIEEFVAALRD